MNPVSWNGSLAFHLDSPSCQSDAISIHSASEDVEKTTVPVVLAATVIHVNEYCIMGGLQTLTTVGSTILVCHTLY